MILILSWLVMSTIYVSFGGGGLDASPSAKYFSRGGAIVGSGAVSLAEDGVFEGVAYNRISGLAEPTLPADTDLSDYDSLVATESCDFVGWSGLLIVTDGVEIQQRSVLVVDCQNPDEVEEGVGLTDLGILADVTNPDGILHWRGY